MKLKNSWNFEDCVIVRYDKITEQGLYQYWESIDIAFEFNSKRHEYFLAKKYCYDKSANESR